MSYDDYEGSRKSGHPVELFFVRFGSEGGSFYAFTDAEAPITLDGIEYAPMASEREKIEVSGRLEDKELSLMLAIDHPLAELTKFYPPSWVITITIRQGHVADPAAPSEWAQGENFPVAWNGRILERVGGQGAMVNMVCGPSGHSMNMPGLRRNYQWSCPHALYGVMCQANKAAATTQEVVTVATGNRVELAGDWGLTEVPRDRYRGGMIQWQGGHATEYRMILGITEEDVILVSGPTFLEEDDEIELVLGCGRTLADCDDLHNNAVNYGGMPWIPKNNPIHRNNHD